MSGKFLSSEGTAELWSAVKERSIPSKVVTQAEYDALSYDERMKDILYVTTPAGGPSNAPISDVPIGAVIGFMAQSAPANYLACDGALHSIAAYPALAAYFQEQFGSANHFGGDGTTTFAVPDLRNLFLRGYHGTAEEQLSGEIGVKQEGTEIPNATGFKNDVGEKFLIEGCNGGLENLFPTTADTISGYGDVGFIKLDAGSVSKPMTFTSRPVNAAVLYCIKATVTESESGLTEYDTDDGWHIRKWNDGYAEMDFVSAEIEAVTNGWGVAEGVVINYVRIPVNLPLDLTVIYSVNTGAIWLENKGFGFPGDYNTYAKEFYIFRTKGPGKFKGTLHIRGRWK